MIRTIVQQIKLFSSPRKEFYSFLKSLFEISPSRLDIYETALIHKSVSKQDSQGNLINNERLEYLGDAIIGAVVAEFLYKRFPSEDEGFLTQMRSKLVNRGFLTQLTYRTGLNNYIKSNTKNTVENSHIYGDALEAVIGALYLDKGYPAAKKFITKKLIPEYVDMGKLEHTNSNFKSQLIEWSQKNKQELDFKTDEKNTNDHNPSFRTVIVLNREIIGKGSGASKKESQQKASEKALKLLQDKDNGHLF